MKYEAMTTDALLELMPDNLHLEKNSKTPAHDTWRVFNSHTKKYVEPSFGTEKELMVHVLTHIDSMRKKWMTVEAD